MSTIPHSEATHLLLIRHAENDYTRDGKLAGWTPRVHLNEEGKQQSKALGLRLASTQLCAIYTSPLERTTETAVAIAQYHPGIEVKPLEALGEVHYGQWTGQDLKSLAKTKLWNVIQHHPSRAQFPDGERICEMQTRSVVAIDMIIERHPNKTIAIISHGDVIKALIAYYCGIPLDLFQRIIISPASVSIIALAQARVSILKLNDTSHYDKKLI
jgi:probable phosphoglycerate mutase